MSADATPDSGQTFLSHLVELRDRLLRALGGVLLVFLALAPFTNDIYTLLAGPLMQHLPEGASMIAIDVAAPFFVPVKLVLMLALVIAIPWVLYQVWSFVAPGLYRHERRLVVPLLASSTVLCYAGMAFAYFVLFPVAFAFFALTAPEGVKMMTDMGSYLDFMLAIFLAFGMAFEVPVIIVVLVLTGITTPQALTAKRRYVIVGAFIVGAILTPPDVLSQFLLAIPLWLLFEAGVWVARRLAPKTSPAPAADFKPLTSAEMDAELDRIIDDEHRDAADAKRP